MKPLVTFTDPERHQVDYLTSELAGRIEAYLTDFTVSNAVPRETVDDETHDITLTGNATHVQVELEAGNAADYPVTERAQVRFTCYAAPGKPTNVKALASLVMAFVYAQPGDANVAGARILGGRSDVIEDPDTGNLMCWFLAELALLATPLAS